MEYRKYKKKNGRKDEFGVFIIHGRSRDWKEVKKFINEELRFATVALIEESDQGSLQSLFQDAVWFDCDCAVAIMSKDDEMRNKRFRARQNVLYEIGYCQGFWDHYYQDDKIEPVIILKERGVEMNSDLHGYKVIPFTKGKIQKSFKLLTSALESMYAYLDHSDKLPHALKKASAKGISRSMIRAIKR